MTADPKRTGIKASLVAWTEPPMELISDKWHGPLGAFVDKVGIGPSSWILCCPGCGQMGSPNTGATWQATGGSFEDVTTLTLNPSIAKNCCGWHGYLRNGVFESC